MDFGFWILDYARKAAFGKGEKAVKIATTYCFFICQKEKSYFAAHFLRKPHLPNKITSKPP